MVFLRSGGEGDKALMERSLPTGHPQAFLSIFPPCPFTCVALGTLGHPLSVFVLLPVLVTGHHKAGPHSLVSLCIPGSYSCGNSLDTCWGHE